MKFEILKNGKVVEERELGEGSFKIGRSKECELRLASAQVSKQHATLVIKGNKAAILDLGSANGVFVNGVMIRKQRIHESDEVVIADHMIRIARPKSVRSEGFHGASHAHGGLDGGFGIDGNLAYQSEPGEAQNEPRLSAVPTPQEKVLEVVDRSVLKPLYELARQVDWRILVGLLVGGAVLLAVSFAAVSLLSWGNELGTTESLKRAHSVLSQTVRENYRILSETNDYTRLSIKAAEEESGIIRAFVIEPETRTILAPGSLLRTPVRDSYEQRAIDEIVKENAERVSISRGDGLYVVAQPIFTFSREQNSRSLSAVVVAQFQAVDGTSSSYDRILLAVLFGTLITLLAYFLMSKMFSHPILVMQEQLDAALKGEDVSIHCESKFPELENLATVINFSVSRLKQQEAVSKSAGSGYSESSEDLETYLKNLREFDATSSDGLMVLDSNNRILMVGAVTTELTGMKEAFSIGRNVAEVISDPALSGTILDISNRVVSAFGEKQTASLTVNGEMREMAAIGHRDSSGGLAAILVVIRMSNV